MISVIPLSGADYRAALVVLKRYFPLDQADLLARAGGRFQEPADMNIDQFALEMKRIGYHVMWGAK